jgi:hypothetical protein
MTENQRRELEAYLNRPLSELEAELALYAPAQRGPADVLERVAGPVRQWLCEDWNWCQVRQDARFEDTLQLGMMVLVVLSRHTSEMPFDADEVLITAIVVKRGMDTFCQCP